MGDRPWGLVLARLGLDAFSGQLTVRSDGKSFQVAFARGHVVGAKSPLTADSIARVALTGHFITSSQVPEITRRLAAAPQRDEFELLAEVVKLGPEQLHRLRHRMIAQRAARTFAIERGDYTLEPQVTIPVSEVRLDIRNIVYLGVRMHLSEQRLASELRALGSRFVLKPGVMGELARFGFTDAERPLLEELQAGASVPELEARHREIDPRHMQAVIYALAACEAVVATVPMHVAAAQSITPLAGGSGPQQQVFARGTRDDLETESPVKFARATRDMQPPPPSPNPPTDLPAPVIYRAADQQTRQMRPVSQTQPPATTMRAPARLTAPMRPAAPMPAPQPEPPKNPILAAAESYARGESALRADLVDKAIKELRTACELCPNDVLYFAMLRWAQFCAAPDKRAVALETKKALEKAVYKSEKPEVARFYLGRVERMLGRDAEALRHFREVLELEPRHAEAASEIRVIEKRLSARR